MHQGAIHADLDIRSTMSGILLHDLCCIQILECRLVCAFRKFAPQVYADTGGGARVGTENVYFTFGLWPLVK